MSISCTPWWSNFIGNKSYRFLQAFRNCTEKGKYRITSYSAMICLSKVCIFYFSLKQLQYRRRNDYQHITTLSYLASCFIPCVVMREIWSLHTSSASSTLLNLTLVVWPAYSIIVLWGHLKASSSLCLSCKRFSHHIHFCHHLSYQRAKAIWALPPSLLFVTSSLETESPKRS